jgi:Ser/Thr protein kinase RdoA (MazF antagonist)
VSENESGRTGQPAPSSASLQGEAPFSNLGPDLILSAVEAFGRVPDGRFIALNSYENRVYQIGLEDETPVIAKFYRPERWSDAQILEEHAFAIELGEQEIPVAVPMPAPDGSTLVHQGGYRVAVFPRLAGDWPDLDRPGRLSWLGRFLGRIHAVGQSRAFVDRPAIDVTEMGRSAAQFLLSTDVLPAEQRAGYQQVTEELLALIDERIQSLDARRIRLHGDCHPSNVLWSDSGPSFVDLDDCRSGPAVQDLWMLVSGEAWEQQSQLDALLEGYRVFADFDRRELQLVEPLRSLRMVYYAGWLARRWNDPAFPLAFPWFGTHGYWRDHVDDLRNQLELLAVAASVEQY